ncbi:uncharacterized protein LTR77_009338 [Saxophila tyrrhenica]|uniref:Uncharacterized protein n=1 Tax=Saxophila tyrrhenica TaxID=1690608 RepID=A0AAV9P2M4_9PEZI|nr:hypothetical protein LTR77_009338 [Saxophila tyrrhenica]
MAGPESNSGSPIKQEDQGCISNHIGETIDLISDDEHEDTMTAILRRPAPPAKKTAASPKQRSAQMNAEQPTKVVETVENPHPPPPTTEEILALQKRLADKFRSGPLAPKAPIPPPQESEQAAPSPIPESAGSEIEMRYKAAKVVHEQKKRADELSVEDEVRFMRLEAEFNTWVQKQAADREYEAVSDDESGLFVQQSDASAVPPPMAFGASEEEEEPERPKKGRKRGAAAPDSEQPATKKGKARKNAKKVLGTNYNDGDVDDLLNLTSRAKAAAKGAKGKASGSKAKPKSRKKQGAQLTNLDSITTANVFRDAVAAAELPSQPKFSGTRRRNEALKQLMASVPDESRGTARSDKKFLTDAIEAFNGGGHAVKATTDGSGNWEVRGMKATLKPYQVCGVAFMLQRERASVQPKGGLLCDEMGLGKTISMLTLIVQQLPGKDKPKNRATLIVAAPALIAQWDKEIRQHVATKSDSKYGLGRVAHHRAGHKSDINDLEEMLANSDIVLTTYYEVMKSYPKCLPPPNLVTAAQKEAYWKETWENDRGLLHKIKWLRVVLDEASAIKNHRSHTSMACRALEAKHYWAISGTPVQNTLQEFYSYFRFLREPHTGTFKIFQNNFCTASDPTGKERLAAFLRKFMIRRTHIDKMFEARLLDLPTPSQRTVWLEFNDIERQVYDVVRKRFIARINSTMAKDESVGKKFAGIWTMVLRLRQITASVLLVFDSCLDLFEREDFEKLNQITASEIEGHDDGVALLLHLRHILRLSKSSEVIEGGISGSVMLQSEVEALPIGQIDFSGHSEGDETGGGHGLSFRFQKYLDKWKTTDAWEKCKDRAVCCGCRQPPDNPYVTSCSHIYCLACLEDLTHLAARRGRDLAKCKECGDTYTFSRPCVSEGFEATKARPTSTFSSEEPATQSSSTKKKKKEDQIDWLGLNGSVLPSAKTVAVKAQILEWLEEDPAVKIICYTQIRLLGKVVTAEGWGYSEYHGKMGHELRANSLEDFQTNPNKSILLCSLRCGGMGLNITAASRVIIIDPWWNAAVEQQAFCRVFRIGQTKTSSMTRLVVKNTIDQAMMNMKELKLTEIESVMSVSKLQEHVSLKDLMRLFGNEVGEDEAGQPFIFADDDGGDERLRVPGGSDDEDNLMGDEA